MNAPIFQDDPIGYVTYWIHWIMATFNMSLGGAYAFWFKANPDTGMTPAETVTFLENNQDQRERDNIDISAEVEGERRDELKAIAEAQARYADEAAAEALRQQEEYAAMDAKEQAEVMGTRDSMEQRNVFIAAQNAQIDAVKDNADRTQRTSRKTYKPPVDTQPVDQPIPEPVHTPIPEPIVAPIPSDYDDVEARRLTTTPTSTPTTTPTPTVSEPVSTMSAIDAYENRRLI